MRFRLLALTAFLSSASLFLAQPLVGKMLLPSFGSGAGVIAACMMLFQALLVGGYAYAHKIARRPDWLRWHQLAAITVPAWMLAAWVWSGTPVPMVLMPSWVTPSLAVLLQTFLAVGPAAFLLATTAPLAQAICAKHLPGRDPYPLYRWSNAGALLGLLMYPTVIEPILGMRSQTWLLAGMVTVFALQVLRLTMSVPVGPLVEETPLAKPLTDEDDAVRWMEHLGWAKLAGLGCILSLGTTNAIVSNFGNLPFLWIAPLAFYLLSYILVFGRKAQPQMMQHIGIWGWISLGAASIGLNSPGLVAVKLAVIPSLCVLFGGLYIHGALARIKPEPGRLTTYFLWISAGGAAGAVLVAVLAPGILSCAIEHHLALGYAVYLLARESFRRDRKLPVAELTAASLLALLLIASFAPGTTLRDFYGTAQISHLDIHHGHAIPSAQGPAEASGRMRILHSGSTRHGVQAYGAKRLPVGYLGAESGFGLAIADLRKEGHPLRVGVLGMGVGNAVALLRPNDKVDFYELSPSVASLSTGKNPAFTYLRDSGVKARMIIGDGRITLQRDLRTLGVQYDVLLVDAFNGGAVPWHLLTVEAMALYHRCLAPGGTLVLHVSNALPIYQVAMAGLHGAKEWFGTWKGLVTHVPQPDQRDLLWPSVMVTATMSPSRVPGLVAAAQTEAPVVQPWTDDRNSLLSLAWEARRLSISSPGPRAPRSSNAR